MSDNGIRPMGVEIHSKDRLFNQFFAIDKLSTTHEGYRGSRIKFDWLIFERGDAVAVVLYKTDSKEIVLVRQFRAPTLQYREVGDGFTIFNDGQLDEAIAGMPRDGETPEDCAIREVREETGYIVAPHALELISKFYSSPGGTSERIFLYYAEVTDADKDPDTDIRTAGVEGDHEDILIRHIPVNEFFANIGNAKETLDSKVLIASMLLRERLVDIPTAQTMPASVGRRQYSLDTVPGFNIVLRTGNIDTIRDVDAWVNSENCDMEMDRFIGRSISAFIRYHGAAKDGEDRVIEDTIAEALTKKMRGRHYSRIGTVHDTTSGALFQSHGVKRLFHVAAVEGVIGKGAAANPAHIELVTTRALQEIEKRNRQFMTTACRSALLPLIGTGDGGLPVEVVLPEMLNGIVQFASDTKKPTCSNIHLNAFTSHAADFAQDFLDNHPRLRTA